jgi:hypothetical protein
VWQNKAFLIDITLTAKEGNGQNRKNTRSYCGGGHHLPLRGHSCMLSCACWEMEMSTNTSDREGGVDRERYRLDRSVKFGITRRKERVLKRQGINECDGPKDRRLVV